MTLQSAAFSAPAEKASFPRHLPIQYGLAGLSIVLVGAPLIPIVYQAFIDRSLYDAGQSFTLANLAKLLTNPAFGTAIWNTLLFAVIGTIISQLIGVLAAVLMGRTDMPGRKIMGELFLWPMYLSALVLSLGWYNIYGPAGYATLLTTSVFGVAPWNLYSIPGMALVAGVSQAPVAYLYCLSSTRITDPALEEAARIAGAGTLRTLGSITLPLMLPAILYSTVLNFTVIIELLAIPLVFGSPANITVLTTFLYENGVAAAHPDHGLLATAAILLLVVVCVLVWLQNRLMGNAKRFVTLGGKATRPRLFQLGSLKWPAFAAMSIYLFLFIIAPAVALFLRAFVSFLSPMINISDVLTTQNFTTLLEFPIYMRSIWNTVLVSTIGAAIATVFISLLAITVHRSEFRYRNALDYIALFPRAVPGVVAGIGFFYAFALIPGLGELRNTIWILVIAFTMRFIPNGYGAISPMLLQMSQDLDRAARIQGADWWTAVTRIVLPLLQPALIACYVILFIQFFKEYATAIFLFAPGSEVIGTSLLQLWIQGELGQVAALATLQITIVAIAVAVGRAIFGVKLYG
ncbi:iron ABC transporter permease [Rhizobium sp. AU243]|uniref:ABC transporter permease n=1 Tax=Rhizobium sp. AU243 TaxID=2303425 RepID=UPI0010CBB1A2|nr:iron ABC transporter permease [Rhizobium sp. AU243]TKV70555.1 iron ABC transporter permease [Rhizobium sp. AU243]